MPRVSAAARSAAFDKAVGRIIPPADLSPSAVSVWDQIVNSLPADRFHASDRPLLALYCRFLVQADEALRHVEKHGAANGTARNPWLAVADTCGKQCAVLASKLRLCPQTRIDRKVAGPAARSDQRAPKPWE